MMKFFEPSSRWLDWMARYAGDRIVFDIGCGAAHITLALQKRGVKCLGIDPRYRQFDRMPVQLMSCVLTEDAQHCRLVRDMPKALLLFCRPCHSGFVQETIRAMHTTSEALYISKPKNVAIDLPDLAVRLVRAAPLCPEEKVYRVVLTHGRGK